MEPFRCPNCGSRAVGKVGHEQFYCWDCCLEYARTGDSYRLYEVADDGSLVSVLPEGTKREEVSR
ncbi:MAG: hypothetical protein ACOX18_01880 [Bacillota bacterium]|jgi:ribosomal protein L37AE/L43A